MTVIVDSNVWIFAEVKDAPEHQAAVNRIQSLLTKGAVATNVVIASEVFHKIARLYGAGRARERLHTLLAHPSIHWMEFTQDVAEHAMKLAEESGIKINDALIAAQALDAKAEVLTDNARDFRRIKRLKVLPVR